MTRRQVRTSCLAVLLAGLTLACGRSSTEAPDTAGSAPVPNPVDPTTAGGITGRVSFSGSVTPEPPLSMRSDPNCQPQGTVSSEALLVGSGDGLQNVFVYVKDGLGDLKFPVPVTPVTLGQQGCRYVPHVVGIQVGQPLEIVNGDPTLHNIHAIAKTNREFNAGQPIQGMRMTHTFTAREVMVPFRCDVHNWMNAWVGVLDHPFSAVSAADGAFELAGLPPGTYTIEAWHEKLGTQTQTVTVAPSTTATAAFTFRN